MAHRINERNTGNWTVDGEPKKRRSKPKPKQLTEHERLLAAEILERVYSIMEYDPEISECGHLHPDAVFTDGDRFVMSMRLDQYESLFTIIKKMGGFDDTIRKQKEIARKEHIIKMMANG